MILRASISIAALVFSISSSALAQDAVGVTEVTPNLLVFATSSGNVVASVGPDGAFLIGTPSAASTDKISTALASRTKNPIRYVVVSPEETADSEGDAGWGKRGAFVAMQEKALERLGGHMMGPNRPLPPRLAELGVDRPRVAFSEVLTFDVNGDAIHIIHQSPGYSNADAVAHFHAANLFYFGELFPGDGYPNIDPKLGGNLDGFSKTLSPWTESARHIVPGRGPVTNGTELKKFLDMLTAVQEQIQGMIAAGRSEQEAISGHPTAEFDAKWGHGRVSPDAFVSAMYRVLKTGSTK